MRDEWVEGRRLARWLAQQAGRCRSALWTLRCAAASLPLRVYPERAECVSGWLQLLPPPHGKPGHRVARVWMYGVAIWEFELAARHAAAQGGTLPAEFVFSRTSPLPLLVRTADGRFTPASEPRLVDHLAA